MIMLPVYIAFKSQQNKRSHIAPEVDENGIFLSLSLLLFLPRLIIVCCISPHDDYQMIISKRIKHFQRNCVQPP